MGKKRNKIKEHPVRCGIFSVEEVRSVLKNNLCSEKKDSTIIFNGKKVYSISDRYTTFFTKGLKCCKCGIEGKYFALENNFPISNPDRYHFNLYAVNDNGDEVLMTKDHIIPKSKGGKNDIDNYQTMCVCCNNKKGDNTWNIFTC